MNTSILEISNEEIERVSQPSWGKAGGTRCTSGMCIIWNGHEAIFFSTNIISHIFDGRDVVVLVAAWKYCVVW